ncbi:MAG TPA: hypothetical protein VG247_35700 [Pseudonocardiaceae bacterium]|jgi:hypothetical protein|nr:hypothetical protein [Pseudonocardiaceae bacterium]
MNDLRWVRSQLGQPTEINIAAIKPNQFVAFVDAAIHHRSPQLGGRTVMRFQLGDFLAKEYGDNMVQDASAALAAWHDACSGVGAFFRSFISGAEPFSNYLKVIPAKDANLWFNLIEIVKTPGPNVNRSNLRDAGLNDDVIDKLLNEKWPGYQNVTVPNAKKVPLAGAPLKRQASREALNKQVPPPATEDRRFFRTWVGIVKA